MRKTISIVTTVAAAMILIASFSFAGPWKGYRGSGGWGMGSQYQRIFNPASVDTITHSGVREQDDSHTGNAFRYLPDG
jgi:hypothetical protein